jgi:hypothetical protein
MNKAQKIVVGFFIASLLVIAGLYFVYNSKQNGTEFPSGDTLYFSFTCPHCKIVEEFIATNNVTSKINFTQKEVSLNQGNARELVSVGKYCKLQKDYIGSIPLYYSDKNCYVGDKEIIEILKNKTGIIEVNKTG